jgi:hypothetical protein
MPKIELEIKTELIKLLKIASHRYWYHIKWTECVLCGRSSVIRTRIYGEKSTDFWKTHEQEQYVCGQHFC